MESKTTHNYNTSLISRNIMNILHNTKMGKKSVRDTCLNRENKNNPHKTSSPKFILHLFLFTHGLMCGWVHFSGSPWNGFIITRHFCTYGPYKHVTCPCCANTIASHSLTTDSLLLTPH